MIPVLATIPVLTAMNEDLVMSVHFLECFEPGAVIAPKENPNCWFQIVDVFPKHGKIWVKIRVCEGKYHLLELYEAQNDYVLIELSCW